jgi:hypothetical protein
MTAGRLNLAMALGFAAVSLGCPSPPQGPLTPAPPIAITDPADPVQRDSLISYARRLVYDTSYGAFDKNLLTTAGDTGTIWPEENIHRTPRDTLERGGRIQLRIVVTSAGTHSFRDTLPGIWAYLPRDTSYVWVDRRGRNSVGVDTARAAIIPVNRSDRVRFKEVVVHRERVASNRALVQWTPAKCWSCEGGYWCR